MSKIVKWVLGILAVLVVIAIVVGAFWFWQTRAQMVTSYRLNATQPNAQGTPGAPTAPNSQNPWRGPEQGFGDNRRLPVRGPMMGGRLFSHFGPFMPFGMGFFFFGGLFRLIVPLVVLALVAILFYQLGKRAGLSRASAPAAPRQPEPSGSAQDLPKSD